MPQELEAQAATPTFTKDVAPILFKNCTSCHRPQGLGPMALLTYQDARKAADDIADVVSSGTCRRGTPTRRGERSTTTGA